MLKKFYFFFITILLISSASNLTFGQCGSISGTDETFTPSGACGPTSLTWRVRYNFSTPQDPTKIYFRFSWADAGNTRTTFLATQLTSQSFEATGVFTYPVGATCSYEPFVTLHYDVNGDGNIAPDACGTSRIDKSLTSWGNDNSISGVLGINPVLQEVCVDDSTVGFQFQDATFPNCDITVEPVRPNQLNRWVQFIYGTGAGPFIPNISIDTGAGPPVVLTDGAGNLTAAAPFRGPIIYLPFPVLQANLNELTYPISHPVGADVGDIFEITLRNWNTCNPYDTIPFDVFPPTDPINGDFNPITTTAQLEIVGPTVPMAGPDQGVCGNSTNLAGNVIANGVGQWVQISPGPALNITNAANPTTAVNITGSNFGTYLLEWRATLGTCASGRDTVELTFFQPPSASNAGPNQNVCGNSTNLAGNNPAAGTGQWFYVGGAGGQTISNSLSRTSAFTGNFGTHTLEWRITNGTCPPQTDQVQIVFEETPTIATAGPDDTTVCNSLTYPLQGNIISVGTGTWTKISGPGGALSFSTNANDPNATVTFPTYGVFQLRWRASTGTGICPNNQDFVNITAFQTPTTATTGGPITLCGLTTTLNGNAAAVGQGTWSQTSGPGTSIFVNENNPTTGVTVSIAGTYDFEWSIENGNCPPSTATTTVTFAPPPTTPDAGADDSVCAVATYNLSGNTITLGTGTWSQIGGPAIVGGFTPNANDPNAQFTFSTEGIYIFEWSSFLNASCPTLRDTVEITLFNSPTNAVVDLPNPITTCALNNIPISANTGANVITSGFGRWFQSSGPATLTITDSLDNTTTVTAPVSGVYTLTWEVSNGPCSSPSTDVLTLNLSSPSPSIPGADDTVCADNYTLSANTPAIGTGAWSVGTQPAGGTFTILPAGDPNATFTITNGIYGAYTLIWSISNPGCPDEVDSLTIRLDENPSPASVIPDFQICADTAQLGAVTPTVGIGQWSLLSGAGPVSFNPNSANPNAVVTVPPVSNTAVYDFEWTTSNGVCPDLSDVLQVTFHEISTTPAAGGDFEVCNNSTNLAGNPITIGTGQWNPLPLLSAGPITITTPSSQTSNITIPAFINDSDTFFLEWTSQNGNCVTLRDTVRVIFHDDPSNSIAGAPINICADTAQLNANIPAVGTGQWIIASGSATLDNNTDPATIVRANPFGGDSSIVVLTWRISNGNCTPENSNVQVVFYKDPTVAAAGSDDSVCALTYTLDGNFEAIGKGDWNQISGPGVSAFANQTLFNTNVTVTQYGTYLFEWTIANGVCLTTRDTVQIRFDEFPSSALAGADDTVCDVTTTLAGNNPAVGNGVWTVSSAPSGTAVATFVDSSVFNTNVTVNEVGAYTFQWTISNGTCADSSDQVTIIFASSNTNTGVAGDTTLCVNDNNKVYTVPFVVGTTYEWFIPAGITVQFGGGINDNFTVLTFPNAGPFDLKVLPTNSFGCASDTQASTLVVYDFPTRDAGPDWALCSGDTAFLGGTPTASGASGFYNYSWTPSSGLDNANIANPIATPLFSRTYFLTVTDSIAGCPSILDTVNVVVNPSPSSNLVGLTPFICEEDTGILQIFFGTGTGPYSVGISNGVDTTIYPSLVTGDSILVTPDSTLTYRVVYLLDSATLCTGTLLNGAPIINVRPLPNATLSSLDTIICEGDAANLNLTISGPTPQIYSVEYAINGTDTTLVNLSGSSTVITVFPDSSSEYTLISVTDNFRGCRVDAPSIRFTDSVFIQVDSLPRANLVGADTICVGDSAALVVNFTSGDGPFDLTILGLGPVNNYNSGDTIWVNPVNTTNYIISQAADTNGCATTSSTFLTGNALILVNPLPAANLIGANTICIGDSTPLQINVTTGTSPFVVVLSNGDTINPYNNGDQHFVSPVVTTTYSLVSVLDTNGCYSSAPSSRLTGTPQVTVNSLPTAQIASDDTICFGDNVVLTFSFTGAAPYTFTFRDNSRGVDSTLTTTGVLTTRTVTVSPDTTTIYSLVSVQGANGCIDSINNPNSLAFGDSVEIVVDSLPVATIVTDLPTDTICNGDLAYLFVNVTTGPGPYTISVNNGVGTISNYISGDTITVSPSVSTAYQITSLLDQNGCSVTTGHPNIDDTAFVVVNPLPSVTLSLDTNRMCFGDTTNLRVALNIGVGPLEFVVSPNLTDTIRNFNPLTDSIPVSPNATTTYSIVYAIDGNGCRSVAPSSNITGNPQLNINPLPTLQMADSTTICLEDAVVLTFGLTGSAPFTFTYNDGLTGTDSTITTFGGVITVNVTEFPLDTTLYTLVSITDAQGCTDSINNAPISPNFGDTVLVSVNPLPITTLSVLEPTDTICVGDNAYLTVDVTNLTDAPGPYTVDLSGGIGVINNYNSGDTIIVTPTVSTTYNIIELIDANGCNVLAGHPNLPDTIRVIVNPLPVVELRLDDNEICLGDSARLFWRVPVGSPRFDFVLDVNPTDTIKSVSTTDSIWVSPLLTTNYNIIYFSDSFGCTVTAPSSNISGSPTLIVNPLPSASLSINKDTVCFGELSEVTFNLTGPNGPYTYQIDTTGNILTGFNIINGSDISFILGVGDHDFNLIEAIDAKGCIATIGAADSLVEVFVHALPIATISGDTSLCDLEPFVLNFALTGNDPLNVYFNDGTNSYVRQLNAPSDTAIISLPARLNPYFFRIDSVVDSNTPDACNATDINGLVTVQVFDRAIVEINSFDTTICEEDQAILTFDISGGRAPFEIDISIDGTTVFTTLTNVADGSIFIVSPNDTTTYTILEIRETITPEACVGVVGTKGSFTVNVNPLPTANLSLVGQDTKCFGDSVTINIQFTGRPPFDLSLITNYAGPIAFNNILTNDTTFNVAPSFPGFGNTISLFTLSDGHTPTCSVIQGDPRLVGNVVFNINDLPTASLNPLGLTSICRGDSAQLLAVISQGDLPYTVYFSDGSTNYLDSIVITTGNTGIIKVSPQNTSTFQIDSVRDGSLPDNCFATSISGSVQITVNDRPTVNISGIDTVCLFENSAFQIQTGGTGPWLVTYSNGTDTLPTFISSSPQTVTVFNPPVGLNVYSLISVTDNGTVPSCSAYRDSITTDTAYVFVNDLPTAVISGDTTICDGEDLPLFLNFGVTDGPFDITITDGINNFNFTGLNQQDSVLLPYPGPGFYVYRLTNVRDTDTDCEPLVSVGQAIVQIRAIPTVSLSVVGNTTICGSDTVGKFLRFNFDQPNVYNVILQRNGVNVDTLNSIGNGTILQAPGLQVGNNNYSIISSTYSTDPKCDLIIANSVSIFVNADPTVTITQDDTICVGNSVNLTITATGTPNWTVQYIGGGINNVTSANSVFTINVSPTITTSYRLLSITDGNGCSTNNILPSDTTEATIVVNQLPTASLKVDGFFSPNVTFCDEDTVALQYLLTGNGPYNVIVSDNFGMTYVRNNVSNLDTLLLLPTPAIGLTQYFFTQVLDNNNPACAPTSLGAPVNITVQALPTGVISGDDSICIGNTTPLTFNFTGIGPWRFQYTDGTLITTQTATTANFTLNVLPNATTTYTLVDVVDLGTVNQCAVDFTHPNITGSATITVEPAVIADFTFISDDDCGNPTVDFTDQTTPAALYAYNWDFGNGNTSVLQNPTNQYVNTGLNVIDFTTKLIVTSPLGCVDSVEKIVQVRPEIIAAATPSVSQGCSPLDVTFTSSTIAAGFQWDFENNGNQLLPNNSNVSHQFVNNGLVTQIFNVYHVTLNQFGCSDTLIIPITVFPKPQPAFSANPVQQNWPPGPVTFTNGTPNINDNTYVWDFGDTANGTSTLISPVYDFGTFGTFTVTLIATTTNGCTDSTTGLVTIFPSLPVASFVGSVEDCVPFTYTFVNTSIFGLSYKWEFSDGSEYFSQDVTKTFFDPGVYDVKLITTGLNNFTDEVEVFRVAVGYANPSANFFSRDTVFVGVNELNFSNESRNATSFLWDFGDGTTSDERSPSKNYRFEGQYEVSLFAINTINDTLACTDTATKLVYVLPVRDIIVPNAFTPTEGGSTGGSINPFDRFNNTVFYPIVRKEFVALKFEVFNRWGEPIFQSNTANVGWDGYVNGNPAPQGVYIYRVQVEFADGTKETKVGDVTLLR